MYVFIDVYINIRYNNKCKGGDNKKEKQERRAEMKLRQKLKLSEKENRELKKKLAERDQTTSERKILVVLAILQIISTILEIVEKILNYLK